MSLEGTSNYVILLHGDGFQFKSLPSTVNEYYNLKFFLKGVPDVKDELVHGITLTKNPSNLLSSVHL